jgi:hypothetical protein
MEEIMRKLSSFCHSEYNTPKYKEKARMRECIEGGKDLFSRANKKLEMSTSDDLCGIPDSIERLSRKLERAVRA